LAPGGLSSYWTGAVPRFAPEDFEEGARLHERYRWPLTYGDLVPYYERAERLLQVSANPCDVPNLPASLTSYTIKLPKDWQRVASQARQYGQGMTPLPLANGSPWLITRSGAAFNSFTRVVPTLRRFPSFQLCLGAHAVHLDWHGDRKQVASVTYVDRTTGAEQRMPCAAVVVAAGPLATTKLLMQSSCSDFPDGLGNTEGLLGQYLHDHAHDWCIIDLERPLSRLGHSAYLTRAPYQESAPLLAASCTVGGVSTMDKLLRLVSVKAKTFGVVIFGTMVPTVNNYVKLASSTKDEFDLPRLDIHVRFDEATLRNVAVAKERLLAILHSAGYQGRIRWSVPELTPGSSVHYGGTVRMHESPRYGMLDAWNRLHAVPNVVVADASSFTTGVEKNPTLTVMALAARASAHLADELKSSRRG